MLSLSITRQALEGITGVFIFTYKKAISVLFEDLFKDSI